MCMEDFSLGRESMGFIRRVPVGTSAVNLVNASDSRIAILITSSQSQDVWISAEPGVAVGQGLHIPAGSPPLLLRIKEFGNLIRTTLFVIAGAANEIGVMEGHLNRTS